MNKQSTFRKSLIATVVASAFGLGLLPGSALASEADIMKKIEALQAEINALKAQVAAQPVAMPAEKSSGKVVALSNTDGITIYGRLDLVAESSDDGKVNRQVLQNISSRIGFKGERKISDDLSGIMQVETGVSPDDSANSGLFASRNSFAGLKSKSMGSIIAGKYDMPFKKLEGNAAPMWGDAEAMEVLLHGKGSRVAVGNAVMNNLHTRQTNVLQYWSPKFSDIEVKLAYAPDEVNGATGTFRKPNYGASIEFDNGMWNAGLATETQRNFTGLDKDMTGLKATLGMNLGAGSYGFAFSQLDNDNGRKTNNWMVAGSYKLASWILKANYGVSSESASNAKDGLKMLGIEADYPLDKNTTLYGYYTSINNDTNARGRFVAGDNNYSPAAGDDPAAFGLGIRYNF